MKTIVNKKVCKEVTLKDLNGNEIIAYKCKSSTSAEKNNYAVLARLHASDRPYSYGFVPLGESNAKPRYMAETWFKCVDLASESRELKVFDDFAEIINAMANKLF